MNTEWPTHDVVLLATADWENPFWTNKQHVARELCRRGFRVLYVESLGLRPPSVARRDLARIARRLIRSFAVPREVEPNLWVASPLALPWHASSLARAINRRHLGHWLARQTARLGMQRPIVWTYNPLVGPFIGRIDRSLLVYHCVDDLAAAPGMPASTIQLGERQLAVEADVVFTTSESLQQRMSKLNPNSHLLPNVADYEHFSQAKAVGPLPADLARIPRPRIGFIGAVSNYKVDFQLIATVAQARPEWHWVLVGQVGEGQPDACADALRLPNIHLLGPRPYSELPHHLRGFDVATIPSPANAYTAAMFPMKFFEYVAAGLPVIASNVPALREYAGACQRVDTADELQRAIEQILAGNRPDAAYADQLARRHTWQRRTDEMLEILKRHWRSPARLADHARTRLAS